MTHFEGLPDRLTLYVQVPSRRFPLLDSAWARAKQFNWFAHSPPVGGQVTVMWGTCDVSDKGCVSFAKGACKFYQLKTFEATLLNKRLVGKFVKICSMSLRMPSTKLSAAHLARELIRVTNGELTEMNTEYIQKKSNTFPIIKGVFDRIVASFPNLSINKDLASNASIKFCQASNLQNSNNRN